MLCRFFPAVSRGAEVEPPGSGIIRLFQSFPMALKATICKAELQVSDLDRHYYQSHSLTLARHPSETDERMMVRLLAFALHACDDLVFGRGLSAEDEADLWAADATGSVALWIDVGLPDERDIRRACHRARRVIVLSYGGRAAEIWWQQTGPKVAGHGNLTVLALAAADSQALAGLAARSMDLQCTIQEGHVWLGDDGRHLEFSPTVLQAPSSP